MGTKVDYVDIQSTVTGSGPFGYEVCITAPNFTQKLIGETLYNSSSEAKEAGEAAMQNLIELIKTTMRDSIASIRWNG